MKAIVFFQRDTDAWFLRGLKRGYRHCFIALPQPNSTNWVILEPLLHKTAVQFVTGEYIQRLILHRDMREVVIDEIRKPRKRVSIMPPTCVDFVKRALGIQAWWVITPHQLYKYLGGK